jgi:hypothetical protein
MVRYSKNPLKEVKRMFESLDNLFRSASEIGAAILVITTCVVVVYLLFNLAPIIETLIQKDKAQESVIVDNKEIHINIQNRTYEIKFNKLKSLFWKLIGISYVVGVAFGFAIIIVIPLVVIAILWIRKVLKFGIFKGVRRVLKIASPK